MTVLRVAKSPCWVERVISRIKETLVKQLISNGNRTEWSPIKSVIMQVIKKIGQVRAKLSSLRRLLYDFSRDSHS